MSVHAEEAACLFERHAALRGHSSSTLFDVARLHERIAGHLDGLLTAGEAGWDHCYAAVLAGSAGSVQLAAVWALENADLERLEAMLVFAEKNVRHQAEVAEALSWVDKSCLRGVVSLFLQSEQSIRRTLGLDACIAHHVNPGPYLHDAVLTTTSDVRARALRAIGEAGRLDFLPNCIAALDDADETCQFWAAWSAVLLGERNRALNALRTTAGEPGPYATEAATLVLQVLPVAEATNFLRGLGRQIEDIRRVVEGTGVAGDPGFVPWLLQHMRDPRTARRAAEAFGLITGVDITRQMEAERPDGFQGGPSDEAEDEDVAMDPDEGLPWPDVAKVEAWWAEYRHRYVKGQRLLVGQPVSREQCIRVLAGGTQRQRQLAARHLCLLEPGTPLFNTGAPAWRQRRWLTGMQGPVAQAT